MNNDPGWFIMLRYSSGYMVPVTEGPEEDDDIGSDGAALFTSEEQAQEWIDNSPMCRSGQVRAEIYEAP